MAEEKEQIVVLTYGKCQMSKFIEQHLPQDLVCDIQNKECEDLMNKIGIESIPVAIVDSKDDIEVCNLDIDNNDNIIAMCKNKKINLSKLKNET